MCCRAANRHVHTKTRLCTYATACLSESQSQTCMNATCHCQGCRVAVWRATSETQQDTAQRHVGRVRGRGADNRACCQSTNRCHEGSSATLSARHAHCMSIATWPGTRPELCTRLRISKPRAGCSRARPSVQAGPITPTDTAVLITHTHRRLTDWHEPSPRHAIRVTPAIRSDNTRQRHVRPARHDAHRAPQGTLRWTGVPALAVLPCGQHHQPLP